MTYGIGRCVFWWNFKYVPGEIAVSIIRFKNEINISVSSKRRHTSNELHGIKSGKTVTFVGLVL